MRRFFDGPVIAEADVCAEAWVAAFGPSRGVLVLAPASATGWFGGLSIVACDPRLAAIAAPARLRPYERSSGLDAAAKVLERGLAAKAPALSAALLRYDGGGMAGTFERGLARSEAGWHAWGDWSGLRVPAPAPAPAVEPTRPLVSHASSATGRAAFCAGVRDAVAAMRAGDVYVLNLCRRLAGVPAFDPATTFATLLARSAATMGALWHLPGVALVSASPERFISLADGLLVVEPIKGTVPRGAGAEADRASARGLAASPKERAEHVMVVDLERNDLGRVCVPGSVLAAPLMRLDTTPYCHQLVSSVGGVLEERAALPEVLAAMFPCGSVTGAPKWSAMEHVARLEREGRAEHTGSLLVALPGRLDSSVLIRTAAIVPGALTYGVGCGITVDSDPEAEWEETLVKSRPLLGCRGI